MINSTNNMSDKEKQPRNNEEKELYLGFTIFKCYGVFGTPYYTILNPDTKVHVHAKTLKIAYNICDEADLFIKYGFFRTKQVDIMNRASKLALRTVPGKRKK